MRKLLVSFMLSYNGNRRYEAATVYMPDDYDHNTDVDQEYSDIDDILSNQDGDFAELKEVMHLFPKLREALYVNQRNWGKGDMYKPQRTCILSITDLGHSSCDLSVEARKRINADIEKELKFRDVERMTGADI